MVIGSGYNTLGPDPTTYKEVEKTLEDLGIILVLATEASSEFFEPIVKDYVFEDLVDVLTRLEIPTHIWEIVDHRTFFQVCYMVSTQIKSAAIGFLQQTNSA